MTISTYMQSMLTADEYERMIPGFTSPVFLNDSDRQLFAHYWDWFLLLRDAGIIAELDYKPTYQDKTATKPTKSKVTCRVSSDQLLLENGPFRIR